MSKDLCLRWDRRDITVFIERFTSPEEFLEYMGILRTVCPHLKARVGRDTFHNGPLCLGWRGEPLSTYSWGGERGGNKLWGHQEFLDAVMYNSL